MHGRVYRLGGEGVSEVSIFVRIGNSGAILLLGKTALDGYYQGIVLLPEEVAVRVWAEQAEVSFSTTYSQDFHPSGQTDQQMDFLAAESTPTPATTK